MIKIKIDENLGLRVKKIFKTNGFDTRSVIEEDLCSSSDFHLINICKEEKRCLVTLDLDFANRSKEFTQIFQGNIWYLFPVSMIHDS